MTHKYFDDFDPRQFWRQSDYAEQEYVDAPVTDETVALVERQLGYKLPKAYIELMKHQNGGMPRKANHARESRLLGPPTTLRSPGSFLSVAQNVARYAASVEVSFGSMNGDIHR